MAGTLHDQVPRVINSPSLTPLSTCFMLFKVYFADDTVLSLDAGPDPQQFTTFGSAPIIRFHGFIPGNSYGVYELLTAFSMPVNVLTIGDLIAAAIQSIQQIEERAILATLFPDILLRMLGFLDRKALASCWAQEVYKLSFRTSL